MTLRFERVTFLDDAMGDLRSLAERSQAMLVEVFRLLKALDAGVLSLVPLHDYAKTGDLADCGKIVVALAGEPEHRIVVRDLGGGGFEVSEVIAVEDRTGDLPICWPGSAWGDSRMIRSVGRTLNDAWTASDGCVTGSRRVAWTARTPA